MKLDKLKLLFESGGLKDATAISAPMTDGKWLVTFSSRTAAGWDVVTMTSDRGGSREFSTLDTVSRVVSAVGFREFAVVSQWQ